MWAWAPWRVRKMRRLVDHVLCKLPFEAEWYQARGCRALYVGHPYFDELRNQSLDERFCRGYQSEDQPLVTLLPGSRTQEVTANLDDFLKVVERVRTQQPRARFAIAAFNERLAKLAQAKVEASQLPVEVHVGRTAELIHAACVCLACSGSVSLELLYHTRPSVIYYRISPLAFRIQKYFRTVRFITLVNLLASENRYCQRGELYDASQEDVPFPEYLTSVDRSESVAQHLVSWLRDSQTHQSTVQRLTQLRASLSSGGASERAARYILSQLHATRRPVRTHYPRPPVAA